MVNFDDCGDSIFLDFDRKMGKEKRDETTTPRRLIDCCDALRNGWVVFLTSLLPKFSVSTIVIAVVHLTLETGFTLKLG